MNRFSEKAFYLLVWRAIQVALIAVVLMVTRSFELATAFLIGANVRPAVLGQPDRMEIPSGRKANRSD